ncbi:MAG: hypothetical protein HYZ00_13045 [Candidatus Hydrogenedentes bacterium]|nr:hypothetical protein [Candidatus Hydrogenedentota bacterium]
MWIKRNIRLCAPGTASLAERRTDFRARPGIEEVPRSASAALQVVLLAVFSSLVFAETVQVREDFARDPQWQGWNNVAAVPRCVHKVQDFGYSSSHHAGTAPGEIGGTVWRSLCPARYFMPIAPLTLDDRISLRGSYTVTASSGGSGVLFGFFNRSSKGWRTPNSLVVRLDGEGNAYRIFYEYGTRHYKTGGGQTFEGRYQENPRSVRPADGKPHAFALAYDPAGAGGLGELHFSVDSETFSEPWMPEHKQDGATFDCVGIMNVQISGEALSLYLDDLEVNGTLFDFNTDPAWESDGSRLEFDDCLLRPNHDFTYRPASSFAGGAPGEIGGHVWRIESLTPEHAMRYGRPVGNLTLAQPLRASGRIVLTGAGADSALLLGWFNPLTAIGAPPPNFMGALLEGPSRAGHYFRPAAGSSTGQALVAGEGPLVYADSVSHTWSIAWDPAANGGAGRLTTQLDDSSVALDVPAEFRKASAALAQFGVLSWHTGGNFVEVYLDDLEFTVAAGAAGKEEQR